VSPKKREEEEMFTIFAKVGADGALLAASGITGASKFGNGRYNLTTDRDITGCALMGTVNSLDANSDVGPGSSSILVAPVDANTLFVRTATPSAASPAHVDDDRPFSVAVFGE
jgi:hypothetical protein